MPAKKLTGLSRIIKATEYSFSGFKAAWKHEAAFRQEVTALAVLIPLGLFLGQNNVERSLLILSPMIVVLTELINSAIEAVVDRAGLELHPLAKQAKDMGSAAVFVSIAMVVVTWVLVVLT